MLQIFGIIFIYLFKIIFASPWSEDDVKFMKRAVSLGSQSLGRAAPNPCVGCVIVDSGNKIVGEGWHVRAGESHAEVIALTNAGDRAKGGTAYVSLEPCNHFGRTPPCTHALLNSSIARVVVGMVDPDPRVSGSGLQHLAKNGVKIEIGLEEHLCRDLNRAFCFRVRHKQPMVTACTINSDNDVSKVKCIKDYLHLHAKDIDTVFIDWKNVNVEYYQNLCANLPSYMNIVFHYSDVNINNNNYDNDGDQLFVSKLKEIIDIKADDDTEVYGSGRERKIVVFTTKENLSEVMTKHNLIDNSCILVVMDPIQSQYDIIQRMCEMDISNSLLVFADSHHGIETLTRLGSLQRFIMIPESVTDYSNLCTLMRKKYNPDSNIHLEKTMVDFKDAGSSSESEITLAGRKAFHLVSWKNINRR